MAKRLISFLLIIACLWCLTACGTDSGQEEEPCDAKPVIYLYPEHETDVSVTLDYSGLLTCTYPDYGDGWKVSASPDGTLTDGSGQTYNYLYWEGVSDASYDFTKAFVLPEARQRNFLRTLWNAWGLQERKPMSL